MRFLLVTFASSFMHHFALIGHPLGHSLSKNLFDETFAGRHDYVMLDIESLDGLRQVIKEHRLSGFNVTIPYKLKILPFLDRLTLEAEEVGAVNCVRIESDGTLTGHNTDSEAFFDQLRMSCTRLPKIALILGTGGAARAVASALRRMGIDYRFVSRNPSIHQSITPIISYEEAYAMTDAVSLIVNATPVGMAPISDKSPWDRPELFSKKHLVYDLIYNPSPTRLMREAAAMGAMVKDGLEMLRRQALLSWEFWGIIDR